MKFPRIILNPGVAGWIRLYQRERRESARLRRELVEWQGKYLKKVNDTPLFTPPPKPTVPAVQPPIGITAKRAYLQSQPDSNHVPTAEEILASAAKRNGN
jgi:hypothetical protein